MRVAEQLAALGGVVAAEIGSFANFRDGIIQRLAAFPLQQRDEVRPALFQQIRRALQNSCPMICRCAAPREKAVTRRGNGTVDISWRIGVHGSNGGAFGCNLGDEVVERHALAEFDAVRIDPLRQHVARQGDFGMRGIFSGANDFRWPPQQIIDGHAGVGGHRHERGVGAILQQAAHQIGEQVAMAPDRRVGAAGEGRAIFGETCIERLAHAMQALEFVSLVVAGQFEKGRHGEGVVGGELRKETRPQRQQFLRTGDVVQIGHRLAGEYRIAVEPAFLRALDFCVPIRALYEAHHHPPVQSPRQLVDVVDHRIGALLIGLNGEAETVPAGERAICKHRGDHVERQFQPIGFLGIDGEVEIMPPGARGEVDDARHQFHHHPLPAHRLVARMQRRQLDGNARAIGQGPVARDVTDRFDRRRIGVEVALRIVGGARAFTEHVEGIAGVAGGLGAGTLQCRRDGFAEHEVAAHQPHRLSCGGADRGRAQTLCEPADGALRRFAGLNHFRRQPERPGGSIDEEGAGLRLVMDEIALSELVFDELVCGARVGHAQQRLGKHHQGEALAGGECELAQHVLDPAQRIVVLANGVDQAPGSSVDPRFGPGRQSRLGKQPGCDHPVIGRVGSGKWRHG